MLFLTLLKEASPKPFGFLLIFSRGRFCSSPSQQRAKNDSVIGAGEAAALWDQQLSRASQHMLKAADFRQVFLQDPFFVCLFLA